MSTYSYHKNVFCNSNIGIFFEGHLFFFDISTFIDRKIGLHKNKTCIFESKF